MRHSSIFSQFLSKVYTRINRIRKFQTLTSVRIEKDSIGEMKIPETADYGIHTARTVEIFPITGVLFNHYPELVQSLAMTKKSAALVNRDLGALKSEIADAILWRATIIAGKGHEFFIVDMLQGGVGTSTNMNANEVIANMSLLHMGKKAR